jgi:hypothetical protein
MPKLIKIEKVETYLGTTYRFYVRGICMGAPCKSVNATRIMGARTKATRVRKISACASAAPLPLATNRGG